MLLQNFFVDQIFAESANELRIWTTVMNGVGDVGRKRCRGRALSVSDCINYD